MDSKRRILVLGTSSAGGDWPPLACIAKGLLARGHEVRCFGDVAIRASMRHFDIPVVTVSPERELAVCFSRWRKQYGDKPITPEQLRDDPPLTRWVDDVIPLAREVAEYCRPELILSQLFCIELAARLSRELHRPWSLVNPGVYFGPDARDLELDYAGLGRYFFTLFRQFAESAFLILHATDPVFDVPPFTIPAHHHYVGPLLWEGPVECPAYLKEAGPPRVLVTVSSVPQRGEVALARAALGALSGRPVRVLLTLSDQHSRDELGAIPENARVESFVPHSHVLRRACLSVSHAGHGIVMRSLYHGVPMVLVPWDRDQPGVAFRAQRIGVAEVVAREALSEERVAEAIAKVLEIPSYRENAMSFGDRLRSQDPIGTACDLIERSCPSNNG